ncbi:unnamed protein product [Rotaria magnacalcarata]|uniref:Fucosyltransferase n=1 Tax=Rotaria magnacalcarata TaxID=392030 RepID=A0A819JZE4_9BILA|nr:unnamed protein product [Rotaria magnacalcarata]CAF3940488.1 unnamed protein product [Rotaria magnacalcarata]
MRLITRHLLPSIRSRRSFVSLLFTISVFLSIGITLRATNQNRQLTAIINEPIVTKQQEVKLSEDKTTLRQKVVPVQKENTWPLDAQGRSLKTNFLVLDWTGFFGGGATEGERVSCSSSNTTFVWTRQHNRIEEADFIIAHDGGAGGSIPFHLLHLNNDQQQYTMAFVMESEVHSTTGDAWARFNFIMTYNLDDSYPEPATYFDMNLYLVDLLTPPSVSFEDKEKQADVVWIISNCNAHNGRESFIQRLMQEIKIDSFGSCLNNRRGYGARMADNVDAYKKYKFVIAIENSNCADYVTEKLVKAVESGSIPIVAGRDGRPDYRRYMPKHSFINIFDYSSMKDLADDIKRIGNNKTLYESYLWYKNNDINIQNFKELSLTAKLKHVADIIGLNSTMLTSGIAGKEKSENKVCKLTRFVRQTPWQDIAAHKSIARAGSGIACLPGRHLSNIFS